MSPALIALIVVHAAGAAAIFGWLMVRFFKRYPGGAVEVDELDFIGYIAAVFMVSVLWELVLLGVGVARFIQKTPRASQPAPRG